MNIFLIEITTFEPNKTGTASNFVTNSITEQGMLNLLDIEK